jgi:hypothetical protein
MKVRITMGVCTTLLAGLLAFAGFAPARAQGQNQDHAVSPSQLHKDVQKAAETRQANEAAVRQMFQLDAAKETLKSTGLDYKQVDQAVGQASDEDLSQMAQRAREVQKDYAAGRLGDHDLLLILLVAVAIIIIIVAVR